MTDPFAWLPDADRRLLESYRRIGCAEAEALLAVGGDLLQRSSGPGGDVDPAHLQRFLDAAGLTCDDVRDALGLRFDAAG